MDIQTIMSKIEQIMHFTLFTLNRTPITPMSIILFIVMLSLFVLISRMIKKLFEKRIFSRLQMDESIGYSLVRVSQYLVMSIGIIVSFQFVGIDLSGLAVIFGLLSVGIGFGLQTIVANFIAGLVLLFERPIRVGDRITVGETEGDVLEINLRSTTVKSLNNISIIVPNSEFISTNVINWSHGDQRVRLDLPVGVSYNSDLDLVIRTLQEVAEENPDILKKPQPEVNFTSFGDSAWNLELRVWINDPKIYQQIRSDINCAIVRKFRRHQIEIPYPQRDLHVRSPLPSPQLDGEKRISE